MWVILGQDYQSYNACNTQKMIYRDAGFTVKVRALNNGKYQLLIKE